MAKPDKAQITYEVNGVESTLRFHSVIAEEHEVGTQVTKFPVQSGFNISNHSIKMNRVVTISGVVSNHQVVGGETFNTFDDSKNVVRLMFSVLKDIVKGAIPCKVTTNYGKYNPVVFTKFRTKLVAGKTDVMEFTMRGEEVQLATTINGNKPNLLVFKPLDASQTAARKTELVAAGFDISDTAILSEATVDMNESFQIGSIDDLGNQSVSTYEKTASDLTSNSVSHLMNTTKVDLTEYIEEVGFVDLPTLPIPTLPDTGFTSGASTVSSCTTEKAVGVVVDEVEETIHTVFGELESSLYGAKYSITGVNNDQTLGQVLLGVGIDCIVIGATGSSAIAGSTTLVIDDLLDNSGLPSIEQILRGADSLGQSIINNTNGQSYPTVLTKIQCGC